MRTLSSVVLLIAFGFAALSLQGCDDDDESAESDSSAPSPPPPCNKEEATTCMNAKTKDIQQAMKDNKDDQEKMKAAICTAVDETVKCVTSNHCCDEKTGGKSMKSLVNQLSGAYVTAYKCTFSEECP